MTETKATSVLGITLTLVFLVLNFSVYARSNEAVTDSFGSMKLTDPKECFRRCAQGCFFVRERLDCLVLCHAGCYNCKPNCKNNSSDNIKSNSNNNDKSSSLSLYCNVGCSMTKCSGIEGNEQLMKSCVGECVDIDCKV